MVECEVLNNADRDQKEVIKVVVDSGKPKICVGGWTAYILHRTVGFKGKTRFFPVSDKTKANLRKELIQSQNLETRYVHAGLQLDLNWPKSLMLNCSATNSLLLQCIDRKLIA